MSGSATSGRVPEREQRPLDAGVGDIRDGAYLPVEPGSYLWGRLPCAEDSPVLTLESGETATIDTLSHEGILDDQGRDPEAFFGRFGVAADSVLRDAVEVAAREGGRDPRTDGPHVVSGPIRVRGAHPGDLLKISVLETRHRVPYGVISNRHSRGALPGEYPAGPDPVSVFAAVDAEGRGSIPRREGSDERVSFALAPFLGIMGVAVAGGDRPHSVPPGPHGGNIDINLLTAGSSLYLPVQVPGALAYVGDPHFAQGDGEVALTALEASLRVELQFEVVPQDVALREFGALAGPLAETTEFLVPTGMDVDLDEAVRECVRAAIALLQARYGMDAHLAYAYLSAATDFNISQVVDIVSGAHARIRKSDFGG
ncbi:acetamidase/formamidase family protein [Marisediminicola sp. LYQ134]|uniref:acetamidase/formamidase family protein n=1 Tax=Marisediminicola sp. LYQ134 TaxID=3391061 RepID=UPI003983557B